MYLTTRFSIGFIGFVVVLLSGCACDDDVCDRRPLGTKTDPLFPNNRFFVEIDDIAENKYIPGRQYKVRLRSRDEKSPFIAFTISLKGDTAPNKANPRKPLLLFAGRLEPASSDSVDRKGCNNTIVQADITPKTIVEALWTAPSKGNKCVSIFAVVAEKPDIWYNFEGPLSIRVCEDPRKSDDMPPLEVSGLCQVCEDARYQLTFEGLWSYNTHSIMFPKDTKLARFSDLVGASHNPDTSLFKYASEASLGLKMLAEQGNSTQFEIEIQKKLPRLVRTVIKAISPDTTNTSTVTSFRATPEHHRLSMAVGILPSPDWFLGVSNLELCEEDCGLKLPDSTCTNKWADSIRLNLYPIDAGTDKGLNFESPNEEMSPPQPIEQAIISGVAKEDIKPFARLHLNLVRTYTILTCATGTTVTDNPGEENGETESGQENNNGEVESGQENNNDKEESNGNNEEPTATGTTTSEEPPTVDPDISDKCPMSQWLEWQPCQGQCIGLTLKGLRYRLRHHVVNGIVDGKPVPDECLKMSDIDTEKCEESCEEKTPDDDNDDDNE